MARFKVTMNTSKAEITPSRPFGGWDVEAIVEIRGGCGRVGGTKVVDRPRPFGAVAVTRSRRPQSTRIGCQSSPSTVQILPRSLCFLTSNRIPGTLPCQGYSDKTLNLLTAAPTLSVLQKRRTTSNVTRAVRSMSPVVRALPNPSIESLDKIRFRSGVVCQFVARTQTAT